MHNDREIFEKHYNDYCTQIAQIDFAAIRERLGMGQDGNRLLLSLFNNKYVITREGITDTSGNRPAYGVCVIIAKYLLLCPDSCYYDPEWAAFKDFKKTSHFTNVNYFSSDTERAIAAHFSGKFGELARAGQKLGGTHQEEMGTIYDLAMRFSALPRIDLLLLFNDGDEEFSAQCKVLFQKHAEFYLDPESLAMTGALLAKSLRYSLMDEKK